MSIDLANEPIYRLAALIRADWSQQGKGVNYAAVPYLDAMHSLTNVNDMYGADSGDMIVAYFLSNASSWRGETAKAVKAELRRRIA
jgi:hypothetical protein